MCSLTLFNSFSSTLVNITTHNIPFQAVYLSGFADTFWWGLLGPVLAFFLFGDLNFLKRFNTFHDLKPKQSQWKNSGKSTGNTNFCGKKMKWKTRSRSYKNILNLYRISFLLIAHIISNSTNLGSERYFGVDFFCLERDVRVLLVTIFLITWRSATDEILLSENFILNVKLYDS